jgi:hypothetical protein
MRILIATLLFSSSSAFAAGYSCLSVDQDTKAVVYFAAPASASLLPVEAPEAKQVVFIDPSLSEETQVLAVFEAEKSAVTTVPSEKGVVYVSLVDESLSKSGKRLGGTRVGLLSQVAMTVQATRGDVYSAEVVYTKKDGLTLAQDFDCTLFLSDDAP